jgi:hypothetical protein
MGFLPSVLLFRFSQKCGAVRQLCRLALTPRPQIGTVKSVLQQNRVGKRKPRTSVADHPQPGSFQRLTTWLEAIK